MKKIALTIFLLCVFAFTFNGQTKKTRNPVKKPHVVSAKILKGTPPKEIKTEPTTLGVSYEHYKTDIDVNSDGTAVQTWEVRQRLNSAMAVERFANYQRIFNGSLERAEVLEAYILKPTGARVPVSSDKIQIKPTPQAEAAPSFSSLRLIEINFDAAKKGDAVCFKVRLHTIKPHFAGHFDELEIFPNIFEYKSIEINLSAPKNYPIYVQAIDLEGGKIANGNKENNKENTEGNNEENGKSRWQWRKLNAAAIEPETMAFDFFSASPRIAMTSFKDYEELGAAYWAEARRKSEITPEIQALADEITKDIKEPQAQAYAVYEWVNKNIRYLSVVLERGGWIPHDSAQILRNGYGDCKDYTTILYSLLRAKNIESHPVIIRAELTEWFPEVAVPSFFNHAVLYIPSLDLYADATAPNTRLGLIPQAIVGRKAFLAGEKTGIVKTPENRPEDNQLLSEIEIDFRRDGSLKSLSKNKYVGRAEILFRPMFTDPGLQQNSEKFVRLLLGYYGIDGEGKLLKIGNPFKASEPFEVEMQTEVGNYTTFRRQGAVRLPVALNLMNMLELEKFVVGEQRKSNLEMGATRFKETFKLNFPEGVSVDAVPADTNFSNPVGSFSNDYRIEKGSLTVTRELLIKKDVITPPEYSHLRELINKTVVSFTGEIKYLATTDAGRKAVKNPVKSRAPKTSLEQLTSRAIYDDYAVKKLSPREIIRLETILKTNPNDAETRKQLLRFYTEYSENANAARVAARIAHRQWFVRNRPELDDFQIYGFASPRDSVVDEEYQSLKSDWLKQVATNKADARIRLNAVSFLRREEPKLAEKLLLEGVANDSSIYEFPLTLSKIYKSFAGDNEKSVAEIEEMRFKAFESGETALRLLKKERSAQRDAEREELLQNLTEIAFQLEKYDRAESLATELILDFGGDAANADFEAAAHIGNTTLGLIAARRGNLVKAGEYLLISVRAPLRKKENYLKKIDTELAKELFLKGEKTVVSEYLKLCTELWHINKYPNLYADEQKALTLWREQIKQGKTPSFDFEKP